MDAIYECDLAYVHATAFEALALGAAPEIIRCLQSCSTPVRRVLDVGCGAGPLTRALSEAGFEVTGVDTSAALLELAREKAPGAQFVNASAYEIELSGYDAIVAVGEPLTYHADSADADSLVSRFFGNVARALPPGGMLIFDVIGLGAPSLAARTWASGEDWAVLVETTEKEAERILVRNIDTFRSTGGLYRRSREVHKVRLFDIPELREQLSSLGFAVETAECYGRHPLAPRRHAFFATRLPHPS